MVRLLLILVFLTSSTVFFGQGCTNSNMIFANLDSSNGNGNGTTYDGKLVFYDLVADFKCENQPAPRSVLTRENSIWTLTTNTAEKCNSTSNVITNVEYIESSNFINYNGITYSLDANPTPTKLTREFTVVQTSNSNTNDVNPGDDICADSDGMCSLQAAFDEMNSKDSTAIINVSLGNYTITQPLEIKILSTVLFSGASSTGTVISGGSTTSILSTGDYNNKFSTRIIKNIGFINGNGPSSSSAAMKLSGSIHIVDSEFVNSSILAGETSHDLIIRNAKIRQNSAMYGLSVYQASTLKILNSQFYDNQTGVQITAVPIVQVEKSSIYNNANIGFRLNDCGTLCEIVNTTISDNLGSQLTIYQNPSGPNIKIQNSTITGKTAFTSTLVSNKHLGSSRLLLTNTIITKPPGGGAACFYTGVGSTAILAQNTIVDDNTCGESGVNITDPQLLPLAMNGGTTPTRLPSNTSPAVDAGNNANCPSEDQRGFLRPFNFLAGPSALCDIGATELQ